MRGRVVADGTEAVLPLRVIDPGLGGRQAEILTVIDTGFAGHLTLSVELARSLALPELGSEEMVFADGRMSQRVAAIRGIARCGECGCALIALTSHYNYTKKDGEKVKHLRPTTVVQPIGGSEERAARCTAPSTPCERKRWYGGP